MIKDYRKLLSHLAMLFLDVNVHNMENLPDDKVKKKIKQVVKVIETWTGLDLYNQFSDLYG